MRRLLYTILTCMSLAIALPVSAMASHRHHHHRSTHHAHRHHARIRHFGSNDGQSGSKSSNGSENQAGDDNDQGENNGQPAGTVTSFSGGALTITLTNGATVSGQVTANTNIRCEPADAGRMQNDDHGDGGGDNSGSGDDDGQGDDGQANGATCTPSQGMVVREAELRISSAGAIWNDVELVS